MQRALIIGWDGATFDLIRPWVEQGKLPAIGKLMKSGTHGLLRSTMPYWTFPAWTSFMTGTNPGKHGIFDFTQRRPGKYELEFVNGGQRRAPTFWKILSQANRQVISVSVPCTFPPERVNGVMISGFDAPGIGGRAAHANAASMYPSSLKEELDEAVGGHPLGGYMAIELKKGHPQRVVDLVVQTIERKAATVKHLMANKPWDCCMILFGESDGAGHQFWKYCDPNSPLYTEQPSGLRDSILEVYQALDRQLAEIVELAPPDTTVLLMSDHGFGGVSDSVLYPNCWLREQGLLRFHGRTAHWKSRVLDSVKLRAVAMLPARLKRALIRYGRKGLGNLESQVRYGMIDWKGTEAYFEENPYYPMLWVNLRGRQPGGIVEPGRHYEEVRDRLIDELESWRHPESGEPIVTKAYRREEVYSGPCVENAPDVIPDWALHEGYSYAFKLSSKSPDLAWIERVDPKRSENIQYFMNKSGTHRPDGIFVAHGSPIREDHVVQGARITDVAPTLLHLLGVPIPEHMDGRVLGEIFADGGAGSGPVKKAAIETSLEPDCDDADTSGAYTAEEEQVIAERLQSLGYID